MAKFIAKGNVKYNGKNYTHGSIIEVKKEHIEEFKKFGWEVVQEKVDAPKKQEEGEQEQQDGQGEGEQDKEPEVDYSKLTNAQLRALLDEKDINYSTSANKAELLALLGV